MDVALDFTEPSQAGPRIRLAFEIAFDQGVRPLKAVRSPGARVDMQIALDCDIAFEQHGAAVVGPYVAADRRWLGVRGDDKTGALADPHVAGDRHEVKGTGRLFRNDDVTCDVGHCRTAA